MARWAIVRLCKAQAQGQWRHPVAVPGHCRAESDWSSFSQRGSHCLLPLEGWVRELALVLTLELVLCPQYDISNGGQPGGGGEYEVQVSRPTSYRELWVLLSPQLTMTLPV